MHRNENYYDLVANGLRMFGYVGDDAFSAYINDSFADKYNFKQFAQEGFSLSDDVRIDPRWVQAETQSKIHSLAAFVDLDSDGPTKGVGSMEIQSGTMPTFKHEIKLNRKIINEQVMLAKEFGKVTDPMLEKVMDVLYNSVDQLLGGNYNTLAYMRHQIVSTGALKMDEVNNPFGVGFTANFGTKYKAKNTQKSAWYAKAASTGVITQETPVTNGTVNPIQLMRDVKRNAEQKDFMPQGHWEVSKTTWDALMQMPYFREMYVMYSRPDVTDATNRKVLAGMTSDDAIKAFIEERMGAKIRIIDTLFRVEKFDKAKGANDSYLDGFAEGVLVYVPDGELGTIQSCKPIALMSSASRVAHLDGGRTMLRSTFNDKTMEQIIETEVTSLLVPSKTRWTYYLEVKK